MYKVMSCKGIIIDYHVDAKLIATSNYNRNNDDNNNNNSKRWLGKAITAVDNM